MKRILALALLLLALPAFGQGAASTTQSSTLAREAGTDRFFMDRNHNFNTVGTPEAGEGYLDVQGGAAPGATCSVGDLWVDTDTTNDTNCVTSHAPALCMCTATNTWTVEQGDAPAASGGGSGPVISTLLRTSSTTTNTSTTPTNVTGLSFSVAANTTYHAVCVFFEQTTLAGTSPRVTIAGPTGANAVFWTWFNNATGSQTQDVQQAFSWSSTHSALPTANTDYPEQIEMWLRIGGTAGTIQPQLAAEVTSADTVTVSQGSYCIYETIGSP